MIRLLFLFFSISLLCNPFFAQYNTARLAVLSGASIAFNFKSINDYKHGILVTNGTIIGVSMTDLNTDPVPTPGSTVDGFELYMSTPSANILGETGVNMLPLNTIQAQATNVAGFAGATFDGLVDLVQDAGGAPGGNRLMLYNDPGIPLAPTVFNLNTISNQVLISYECGRTAGNNLLGSTPDFYSVDIEIWIWPQCNGGDCP